MSTKYKYKCIYNLGDIVITDSGSKYKIVGFKIRTNKKPNNYRTSLFYQLYCSKCGNTFWVQSTLVQKRECSCIKSNNHLVVYGVNDITTTHPWMVQYFPGGARDAKNYRASSAKEIKFVCPYCGKEHITTPAKIKYNHKLSCVCLDSHTYPEKFVFELLNQLSVDFDYQAGKKVFNFLENNYRYDFSLKNHSCIIETHGDQHYSSKYYEKDKNTELRFKARVEKDKEKEKLARENGIQHYVVLDCRKSNAKWIKESIMSSELPTILSFKETDVDWKKCDEFSSKNIWKEICDYYMLTMELPKAIGEKYNYRQAAISKILTRGNDLGWCIYKPKKRESNDRFVTLTDENGIEIHFKTYENAMLYIKEKTGKPTCYNTIRKYIDKENRFRGWLIKTLKDPKKIAYLIYGDEAVKWYEEHEIK